MAFITVTIILFKMIEMIETIVVRMIGGLNYNYII